MNIMGIVLNVLRILGILLLIILCLILVLLLFILLIPVRYRAEAVFPEKQGCPMASLHFTWFAHLISFRLNYSPAEGLQNRLKILGIRFRRRKRSAKEEREEEEDTGSRKEEDEKDKSPVKQIAQEQSSSQISLEDGPSGNSSLSKDSLEKSSSEDSSPKNSSSEDSSSKDSSPEDSPSREKMSEKSLTEKFASAVRKICEAIKSLLTDTETAMRQAGDRIEKLRKTWAYYRDIFEAEDTGKVLDKVFGHSGKLLSHIKPRRLNVNLEIGTGDPASTANILAVHGMLYPLVGENIHIEPDFEHARLTGELYAKGRIRACVVLYYCLSIILDKKTWKLIRQLKKED